MASTTIGLKVDEALRERLRAGADALGRTPHWLIKQAVLHTLDRIERGETPFLGSRRRRRATRPAPFLAFAQSVQPQSVLRAQVTAATRRPEPECLPMLLQEATLPPAQAAQAQALARRAGGGAARQGRARAGRGADPGIRAVQPGRRRPDVPGRGAAAHSRPRHPRRPDPRQDRPAATGRPISAPRKSLFVNAATWGLLITGRLAATSSESGLTAALVRLIGARRRAADPARRRCRHAHDGRAVRRRPDASARRWPTPAAWRRAASATPTTCSARRR